MILGILYFTQYYYPLLYGGGEYILFNAAKELIRRGHKVMVIAQKVKGLKDYEEIEGIHIYRVGPEIEHKGSLPLSLKQNLGYVLNSIVIGMKLLKKGKVDLICSNTYAPALTGALCALFFRKPHIITVHDVYSTENKNFWLKWYSQQGSISYISVVGTLMEKILVNLPANAIHTVSKTSEHDLNKVIKLKQRKRVIVIPNGIDLEGFKARSITYEDLIVYIGRLVFYKNVDQLIKSFRVVCCFNPKARLLVIGDGPMRYYLEKLTKEMKLEDQIIFTGHISHEEKVRYLSSATALVLPSMFEGFGIVVLEAWALRKPVIVANIKPLNELVEHGINGFVINPYNPLEIANSVKILLRDKLLAKNMGENGYRKLVNNYTIEKCVDKLEKLYLLISSKSNHER